ncbi:MAG: hypothetical protein NTX52_06830 [Planctomycetota bacterium]|nr:hypothetical protein [Planctomycetota bacterium]
MSNGKGSKNAVENVGAIFLGLIFFFFIFIWTDILPSQIGSYPVRKQPDQSLIPLNRTVYKVNPMLHTIIYWMPGIDETPRKLVDCVVRDKKNWIGYYPDGSGSVEMRKGKIVTGGPNEVYIGKYHWWLRHFGVIK